MEKKLIRRAHFMPEIKKLGRNSFRYDVLIIVDMQTALVDQHPYNACNIIKNIKDILKTCREKKIPVIYIRHDGGQGDELEAETAGWQIYEEIKPLPNENIFDKQYNSAFKKTGLQEYMDKAGMKNIILCGMQSEHCLDATCKVAFELEYNVTIPREATTTFDNTFASGKELSEYYENKIWDKRYAAVMDVEQVIAKIRR